MMPMVIYNVTTKIDWSIDGAWVQWMKEEHIPNIINTGYFVKHQLVKLIESDNAEGPTYAAQYFSLTLSTYDAYIKHYAAIFSKRSIEKWGHKFISFSSLMEIVD